MTAEQKKKLALKNMVRFRNDPHYIFWRNVYQYPNGKEENMATWLNGRKPPYMESTEKRALNADQIKHAVTSMSYEGLQRAALAYFMVMNKIGLSPKDMVEIITADQLEKKAEKCKTPLTHFSALDNHSDDNPAA